MALIPLKQEITVTKPYKTDKYNRPLLPETVTMKCRLDEQQKTVKRASSSVGVNQSMSNEVQSSARIILDKLADIRYEDTIEYTNELGITTTYTPLDIEPKRNLAGKVILTVVYV
ncbi:hypothetical protein [Paenisporosarcina sp. NPDC076898]|uniref:hypothetical protein n=1 Tax=unclassified Paenisporosarcina TaxID=2642018 RepID=UPI003D007879